MKRNYITKALDIHGNRSAVGRACGVTPRAVRRWEEQGHLPRSEWTGQTNYAEIISRMVSGKVTKKQLLSHVPTWKKPGKAA